MGVDINIVIGYGFLFNLNDGCWNKFEKLLDDDTNKDLCCNDDDGYMIFDGIKFSAHSDMSGQGQVFLSMKKYEFNYDGYYGGYGIPFTNTTDISDEDKSTLKKCMTI